MNTAIPFRPRISKRYACDVPVLACTTIACRTARIADISEHGAQVRIAEPYPEGARIHLELDGEMYWATVAWAEIDRMGIRFDMPLRANSRLGALIETLKRRNAIMTTPNIQRTFGRKAA